METAEIFQRLGLALAIGFLVGVERGWKQRAAEDESRVAGLRTYTLIGLLGGVAALLGGLMTPIAFAALALVFGLAWTLFKFLETQRDGDLSVTGLVAGILTFALGAYAVTGDMRAAAAGGVVLVLALAFKTAMHEWLGALTWSELRSALLILAASFVALPVLPDRAIDPWGAVNPSELWRYTILIAGVSFAGYVALRVLGPRAGHYVGALAGALVSSTAVTLDLARRSRKGETSNLQAGAAAALANVVLFTRVGVLIGIIAPSALPFSAPALAAAAAASLLGGLFYGWRAHGADGQERRADVDLRSPLDLKSVAQFALLLAGVTIAARLMARFFGDAGLTALAATAGIADVDPVAAAVGGLVPDQLDPHVGAGAILLAAAVNSASKTSIAALAGSRGFALLYGAVSLVSIGAGLAVYTLTR